MASYGPPGAGKDPVAEGFNKEVEATKQDIQEKTAQIGAAIRASIGKTLDVFKANQKRISEIHAEIEKEIRIEREANIRENAKIAKKAASDSEKELMIEREANIRANSQKIRKAQSDADAQEMIEREANIKENARLSKKWADSEAKWNEEKAKLDEENKRKQQEFLRTPYAIKEGMSGKEDVYGLKEDGLPTPPRMEKSPIQLAMEERERRRVQAESFKPMAGYKEEKAEPISMKELIGSGAFGGGGGKGPGGGMIPPGFGGGNLGMAANLIGKAAGVAGIAVQVGQTIYQGFMSFADFSLKAVAALDPSLIFRFGVAVKDLYATVGIALKPMVEKFVEGIRLIADYLTPVMKRLAPVFEGIGQTMMTILQAVMPFVSLLIEGIGSAIGILNDWIVGPLAKMFKWFADKIGWLFGLNSDFEKGASAGAAAMKASYSGIAEYGRNIMQQALGSSSGEAAIQTADYTRRTADAVEKIANRGTNNPREISGPGLKAQQKVEPAVLLT